MAFRHFVTLWSDLFSDYNDGSVACVSCHTFVGKDDPFAVVQVSVICLQPGQSEDKGRVWTMGFAEMYTSIEAGSSEVAFDVTSIKLQENDVCSVKAADEGHSEGVF